MVMLRPWFLKVFVISFLVRSAWGPDVCLNSASPSSQ